MRVSYSNYFNNVHEKITRFWLAESSEWVFQKAETDTITTMVIPPAYESLQFAWWGFLQVELCTRTFC